MQLVGDAQAIAELKELVQEHKEYMKFLVAEARSNTDHATSYRGKSGAKYTLKLDLAKQQIEVAPAPE